MSITELADMDYEAQLLFTKEYLPLIYQRLAEDEPFAERDKNDMSPILPSFNDDDEMYFSSTGRRIDP